MGLPNFSTGGSKLVLQVGVLLLAFSKTVCEEPEMFTINGTTCFYCSEDMYLTRICTATSSTQCAYCSKCNGEGQKILANCTRVTDTQCGCKDGYRTSSIHGCQKVTTTPPTIMSTPSTRNHFQRVTMLGAVPVFLAFIFIILAISVLFIARAFLKPAGKRWRENSTPILEP